VSDSQSQWALLLLRSLVDAGVRDAVISPGSRSTPLVWAASQTQGLSCHCLIDERSAGFYALGQARLTGLPSVLICTSGTALSHYYPAVIEARESGTPLIVLSADRPFELQHCGAQQTIDQTRIFGNYAPFHELGTPVADRDSLLGVRRTAWQAVAEALESPRGAVHLNFRARKPLEPSLETDAVELPEPGSFQAVRRRAARPVPPDELEWLIGALEASECPLLVCGALSIQDSPSPELVRRFVELSGCVLCPEAVSQLRFRLGPDVARGAVCDAYDWLLGSPALRSLLKPDFALQIGATPVSSALERLIQDSRGLRYAICAETGWPDPMHKSARILRAEPSSLLQAACTLLEARGRRQPSSQVTLWQRANAIARAVVDEHVRAGFGEAAAVAILGEALPDGSVLAVGNSLPPRLLDRYCRAAERRVSVLCQRGASGIEGAIAGVLGAASRAEAPATLLLGDISFLHDVGSLWAAQAAHTHAAPLMQPIVIVVLNNGGGRIFEQLPIATRPGIDLHWWTTPHQLRLEGAALLYGVAYSQVEDGATLTEALSAAYARHGVTLIEVVVSADNAMHSLGRVAAELEPLLAAELPLQRR
jgi:2-succinyl-5-enolpyruvyl-6-hydroxy-3-cyclohexene-1-carboxylate synthase